MAILGGVAIVVFLVGLGFFHDGMKCLEKPGIVYLVFLFSLLFGITVFYDYTQTIAETIGVCAAAASASFYLEKKINKMFRRFRKKG